MGYLLDRLCGLRLKARPVHFQSHVRLSASVTAIRLCESQRCRKEQNAYEFCSIGRLGPHEAMWVQLGFELFSELRGLVAFGRAIAVSFVCDDLQNHQVLRQFSCNMIR